MLEAFNCYHSYLISIEALSDEERGRLFTALLKYSATGETPPLPGNERFLFPQMKWQIDRDKEHYSAFCERQSENGKRGGRPKNQKPSGLSENPKNPPLFSETQKTQGFFEKPKKAYDKNKDNNKDKDNITQYVIPSLDDVKNYCSECNFSDFDYESCYRFWASHNWIATDGRRVRNWKALVKWHYDKGEFHAVNQGDNGSGNSEFNIVYTVDGTDV